MHLFALDLEQLSEVGLRATTDSLDLALHKGIKLGLRLGVDVVNQEVFIGLLDIGDLSLEELAVRDLLAPPGRQWEGIAARSRRWLIELIELGEAQRTGPLAFGLVDIGTLGYPALIAIESRHTEASSLFDAVLIELSQAVLNINAFLSGMVADLVEDAGEGLLSETDLKLLSLDL